MTPGTCRFLRSARASALAAGLAVAGLAQAGTANSLFEVRITLLPPGTVLPGFTSPAPLPTDTQSSVGELAGSGAQLPVLLGSAFNPLGVLPRGTPAGICSSQAHRDDQEDQVTVSVVCSLGQYVRIEPIDLPAQAGVDASARRFAFGPTAPLPGRLARSLGQPVPVGTITSLRISNLTEVLEPALQMLVSF